MPKETTKTTRQRGKARSQIESELLLMRADRKALVKCMTSYGNRYIRCFQLLADRYGVQLQLRNWATAVNGSRWRTRKGRQRNWRPLEDVQLINDLHALQEEGKNLGLDYKFWELKPGYSIYILKMNGAEHLERLKHEPE